MRRGRKPKPTETKRREGNPGRRPLNDREPAIPAGAPVKPPHVTGPAAECWTWLCDQLDQMGLLAQCDQAIVTLYCDAWADYVASLETIETEGRQLLSEKTGAVYNHPATNNAFAYRKQLHQYAVELGLSPSARSRVTATGAPAEKDDRDKFFPVTG